MGQDIKSIRFRSLSKSTGRQRHQRINRQHVRKDRSDVQTFYFEKWSGPSADEGDLRPVDPAPSQILTVLHDPVEWGRSSMEIYPA